MTESDEAIALARANLTAKLVELRRREAQVRTAIAPMRHLANPWLYIGIAAVVGYRLGRPRRGSSPAELAPHGETLTRAIVRASLVAIAGALVRRTVERLVDERAVTA